MNIFIVENSPELAARSLCNRHISRMPLESMGMLMFAFNEGYTPIKNDRTNRHYVHPASIWARKSRENFEWLLEHALAQCDEYTIRYKREHDSQKHILWAKKNYKILDFEDSGLTPFARCFSSFKEGLDKEFPDTIKAYREFYNLDKSFAKWPSLDKVPNWWRGADPIDKNFKNGEYTKR